MADETTIEQPVQAPVSGGEPTYTQKVYNALKDNLQGFNKTPDEFTKAMQDPAYATRAYQALKENLTGFNKTPDEFYSLVGSQKKNPIGTTTQSLPSGVSTNGSQNFLPQQPTINVPLQGEFPQQVAERNQVQQNKLQEAVNAYAQAHNERPNIPSAPPTSEDILREYHAPTVLQRIEAPIGSAAKGVEEMVGSPFAYALNKTGLLSDKDYSDFQNSVANGTQATFGMHPNYLSQGMGGAQNAVNNLAKMVPALATAGVSGGTSFGLQQMGNAATQVAQAKQRGVEFKNHSDDLWILGNGLIGTALGRGTMGKAFDTFGKAAQDNVVAGLAAETIKELPANATAEEIQNAFLTKAQSWSEKFAQAPLKALTTYAKVGSELSAAGIAGTGLKYAANKLSGNNPLGEVQPSDLVENIKEPFGLQDAHGSPIEAAGNILTSPAGGFGLLEGGLGLLNRHGGYMNPIVERLQTDNSPQEVENIKNELTDIGQQKGWTPEETQQAQNGVDQLAQTVGKLPKGLPPEKMQKGVELIQGRNELDNQLAQLKDQRSQLDPSVADIPSEQETFLQDKIDQANDKLRTLVTGDRATYSKGIGEDEGKFFKTVNGEKEEIPESRYNLESLERDVKAEANKAQQEQAERQQMQDETDQKIIEFQKNFPDHKVDMMDDLPEHVVRTFDRIDSDLPTDPVAIGEASDWLYNKYKELTKMKESDTRMLTIPQIEGLQEQIGKDITSLEDYKTKQRGEETEPTTQADTGTVSEAEREGIRAEIAGQKGEINAQTEPTTENVLPETPQEVPAEKVNEEPQTNIGGENHALSVGKSEALPLDEASGNSAEVGERVPKSGETTVPQEQQNVSSENAQPKEVKISDKAKALADKIRSLKSDQSKLHGGLEGIAAATWDGALETIASTVEAGGKLVDAINEGVKHILANHPDANEKEVRDKLNEQIGEEPQEEPKEPIGISREETKKQREMRGLEDLPEADRVTLSDMFDKGKAAIENHEVDPVKLAIEIADKPRNLSPTEVNALLYDRQRIRSELEDVQNLHEEKLKDPDSDPTINELVADRQRFLEGQLDTNERALRAGARENSLALNAMKSMINADYTLATQRARMRTAVGGELTPAMETELERYKKERDEAIKRLDDYQTEQKNKELQREINKQKRQQAKVTVKEALKAERKSIVEDFRAELKKARAKFSDAPNAVAEFVRIAAPFMKKMLTNLAKEGIVEAKDVIARIHDEFKDDIPNLSENDVRDALLGKHDVKKETKNDLLEQKNAILKVIRLEDKLQELKDRKIPEKKEKQIVQRNKQVADLEQQIKQEKAKISAETKEERTKEALKRKIDRINERIKNNDFAQPVKQKVTLDPELLTLQNKVKKAENNFDAMAERLHAHKKTGLEKTLTTIQQIRRAMLLSGTKTLAKLYAFATGRSITTPIEELVTEMNRKIPFLGRIIARSPRFAGGFNAKAEALAITTRWSKATLKDSWIDVLKSGVGELDRMYGRNGVNKDFDLNPSALEFFGRLHGAFKNSTKRAEFFRSFQKRLEYAASQGHDINDPNVQFVNGLEAYADAKRSILMNDNLLVDKGYKSLLRGLEQGDSKNPNNAGKVLAAVIRGLFPIVKIPTNYVLETSDIATLGVRAIPNIIKAMTKGVDSLTPKEADMVARTVAKGQIGLALMTYAYFNPDMFGGYYSGQRKDNDLSSGDIKIGGITLPHFLSHNPYFEAMQIAATMRRAIDKANQTHGRKGGVVEGAKESAKGLTEQIPFSGVSDIFGDKNSSASDVVGKAVKSLVEPRLLQEIAEATDKGTDEKHKRNPKGFEQQLESGIPGLRSNVPLKKKKKY